MTDSSIPSDSLGPARSRNRVFVEAGTASGREPTDSVRLQSYVGQFLQETGISLVPTTKDRSRCGCCISGELSSRRCSPSTPRWRRSRKQGKEIGGYARHYYDLLCLADRPEVVAMLRSEEYGVIKADYDRISREHFPKSYIPPPDMSFAHSDALFPPPEMRYPCPRI